MQDIKRKEQKVDVISTAWFDQKEDILLLSEGRGRRGNIT